MATFHEHKPLFLLLLYCSLREYPKRASKINLLQIFSHYQEPPKQNKIKALSSTKKPTKQHTIVQKLFHFKSKMVTFAKMTQTVDQVAANIRPVLIWLSAQLLLFLNLVKSVLFVNSMTFAKLHVVEMELAHHKHSAIKKDLTKIFASVIISVIVGAVSDSSANPLTNVQGIFRPTPLVPKIHNAKVANV